MKRKSYTPVERLLFVTKSPFRQKILIKRIGEKVQYIVKLFVIGSSSAGKTAFVKHWIDGTCPTPEKLRLTVGVDFALKHIKLDDKTTLTIQVWDFGGEQRFWNIISLFLGGSIFGLVFFDMAQKQTLLDVQDIWLPLISRYYDVDIAREGQDFIAIVGNKQDLLDFMPEHQVVSDERLRSFQERYPLKQFIISAKTGYNLNPLTDFVIENIRKALPEYV